MQITLFGTKKGLFFPCTHFFISFDWCGIWLGHILDRFCETITTYYNPQTEPKIYPLNMVVLILTHRLLHIPAIVTPTDAHLNVGCSLLWVFPLCSSDFHWCSLTLCLEHRFPVGQYRSDTCIYKSTSL